MEEVTLPPAPNLQMAQEVCEVEWLLLHQLPRSQHHFEAPVPRGLRRPLSVAQHLQ